MDRPLRVLGDVNYMNVLPCFNWKTVRPTENCPLPGFFVELIDLISTRLNRTIQFFDDENPETLPPEFDVNDDDLIFNALRSKNADFLSAFMDNSSAYGEGLDVTNPIYFSHTKYIVARVDSTLMGFFDFFSVYDLYIWTAVCFSFILIFLTGLFIYWVANKLRMSESKSFGSFAWSIARLHLIQSETENQNLASANSLILIFALLQCGIIVRMYNNLITTQAVRYIDPMPFRENELLQVLKEGKYSLLFQSKLRWWYQDIMNENLSSSPFYEIRHAIRNNPIVLAENNVDASLYDEYVYDKVAKERYITIDGDEAILYFRQMGHCNYVYMDTGFPPKPKYLLMRKRHPLLPRINQIILEETVNIRRLHDKYFKYARPPKCDEKAYEPKALALTPFYGIILLFGVGSVVSVAIFFGEILLKSRRNEVYPVRTPPPIPSIKRKPPLVVYGVPIPTIPQRTVPKIATHKRIRQIKSCG